VKTIWKFPIEIADSQLLSVPEGAKFISVLTNGEKPLLYAIVDPESPTVSTTVQIRGTGHPVQEDLLDLYVFLGTVTTHGFLVWHIFVPKEY